MTGLSEKIVKIMPRAQEKKESVLKSWKWKPVKPVAKTEFKGNCVSDLFFVGGRGVILDFFTEALFFWLLFQQGKSDKI